MKNIYILLALLFVLAGCTGFIDEPNKYDKDCIVLNIVNGPMTTKATNEGTEYERMINRLDCFFYVKDALDKCVYYQKITNNSTVIGRQEIPFYVDESVINRIFPDGNTTCDVFVIANYPGDNDWTAGDENTSVTSLKNIVLDLFETETSSNGTTSYKHDAVGKPFVMAGFDIANKGEKNNASGEILLVRAASKITLQVKIPEWIDVKEVTGDNTSTGTNTTVSTVRYYPHLTNDSDGKVPLRTAFHNGVSKTYLSEGENYNSFLEEGDYFSTDLKTYSTPEFEDGETEDKAGYYTCQLEVPFYSYARSWAKGDVDAPYLTLQMPWKKTEDGTDFNTYYYQIMVNAGGLKLSPNSWYDLTVNVGVLGSLTPSVPTEIKSDDITYYILDWTKEPSQDEGDRYEDVVIKEYAYLEIPEKRIIINNSNVGYIPYYASHAISISMDASNRTDEILGTSLKNTAAYYIDGKDIEAKGITNITATNNFNTTERPGYIKYTYEIPDNIYSPIYVHIIVNMQSGDRTFSEKVTIVQYPAMYIIPEWSTLRSIYVNNDRGRYQSNSDQTTSISGNNITHPLGSISGVQNFSGTNASTNNPMYTITVTSFNSKNTFEAPRMDDDGYFIGVKTGVYSNGTHSKPAQPETTTYGYIIGDPRVTSPDNDLGGGVKNSWATASALVQEDGNKAENPEANQRKLIYYYPSESKGEAFRVVAPKFRIVSFNNASGKNCTHLSAAMRCASVQEDGFPAGRWRLPTVAEIQYIILLQEANAIQEIFTSTGSYYATAAFSDSNNSKRIAVAYRDGKLAWNSLDEHISVRCVYDEWYWGSNRDAVVNTGNAEIVEGKQGNLTVSKQANKYLFTWGDEPRR